MKKVQDIVEAIPKNGTLSIVQRDLESNGDKFALKILKYLLENSNMVFLILYEPYTVLKSNLAWLGVNIEDYLGKNLMISLGVSTESRETLKGYTFFLGQLMKLFLSAS
ncbi:MULTISPECIES: hypothetical protein [Pyrococcus]|uniref:hypothetical protein n=1 Tax=Pyrococcus TaxID=2260 RepID=UPI000B1006D1|nr:hypothetical protein [Pyrococcus furiosus]